MTSTNENCEDVAEARERYLRFMGNAAGSNVEMAHQTAGVAVLLQAQPPRKYSASARTNNMTRAHLHVNKVTVLMHEKTSVNGVLVAMKGDGSHFIVDQLKTPIGIMDSAVLRTADTIMMTLDWNDVNRHH